jgi:hypothetical protein
MAHKNTTQCVSPGTRARWTDGGYAVDTFFLDAR